MSAAAPATPSESPRSISSLTCCRAKAAMYEPMNPPAPPAAITRPKNHAGSPLTFRLNAMKNARKPTPARIALVAFAANVTALLRSSTSSTIGLRAMTCTFGMRSASGIAARCTAAATMSTVSVDVRFKRSAPTAACNAAHERSRSRQPCVLGDEPLVVADEPRHEGALRDRRGLAQHEHREREREEREACAAGTRPAPSPPLSRRS